MKTQYTEQNTHNNTFTHVYFHTFQLYFNYNPSLIILSILITTAREIALYRNVAAYGTPKTANKHDRNILEFLHRYK